jgi:hypothetical protein
MVWWIPYTKNAQVWRGNRAVWNETLVQTR